MKPSTAGPAAVGPRSQRVGAEPVEDRAARPPERRPAGCGGLVTAAREENLLHREDGRWHLTRAPTVTPRILELAVGTGRVARWIGRRDAAGRLTAVGGAEREAGGVPHLAGTVERLP